MENLLNKIKELVEAYNQLPNSTKMTLVPEEYAKSLNLPIEEKYNDVSNYYICLYNNGKVGIFKQLNYSSQKTETNSGYERWEAGALYIGVNSSLVGIKVTHHDIFSVNSWKELGQMETVDDKRYVCNCKIHDDMTFDEMRLLMYEKGEIGTYSLGKATDRELINVLNFAHKYYEDKIIIPESKIKKQ